MEDMTPPTVSNKKNKMAKEECDKMWISLFFNINNGDWHHLVENHGNYTQTSIFI